MSKLDSITVGIVVICILAILFLVYKMTDLFKSDKPTDKIETVKDSTEVEDDIYDYTLDDPIDTTSSIASGNTRDSITSTQPTATEPAATKPKETPVENYSDESPAPGASSGRYMVLAGSFTKKTYAQTEVSKLKKKGYNNARVELFDRGKFAVILVDRFDNMAEAERLVKKLKADSVVSYVKLKDK